MTSSVKRPSSLEIMKSISGDKPENSLLEKVVTALRDQSFIDINKFFEEAKWRLDKRYANVRASHLFCDLPRGL